MIIFLKRSTNYHHDYMMAMDTYMYALWISLKFLRIFFMDLENLLQLMLGRISVKV